MFDFELLKYLIEKIVEYELIEKISPIFIRIFSSKNNKKTNQEDKPLYISSEEVITRLEIETNWYNFNNHNKMWETLGVTSQEYYKQCLKDLPLYLGKYFKLDDVNKLISKYQKIINY